MRRRSERGAALVEFALLAPLLIILVMGIIEFGWLFAQMNEIRHVAQEGARWGAVSRPDIDGGGIGSSDLFDRACAAANLPSGTTVTVASSFEIPGQTQKEDTAAVTVTANVQSLSGLPLITAFLPTTLTNTATFRLEQDAQWAAGSQSC